MGDRPRRPQIPVAYVALLSPRPTRKYEKLGMVKTVLKFASPGAASACNSRGGSLLGDSRLSKEAENNAEWLCEKPSRRFKAVNFFRFSFSFNSSVAAPQVSASRARVRVASILERRLAE